MQLVCVDPESLEEEGGVGGSKGIGENVELGCLQPVSQRAQSSIPGVRQT